MNSRIKMWSIIGLMDLAASFYCYFITQGSSLIYITVVPTILFLSICLPLDRTMNQIMKVMVLQQNKCFNCNLNITDKDAAVLEDNNHVYCQDCDKKMFGHTYVNRGGVWYKK